MIYIAEKLTNFDTIYCSSNSFNSLGAALYELACGQIPISSNDPAEIVHFHFARTPLPVHQINPEIPKDVSVLDIIKVLLNRFFDSGWKNALIWS